MTDKLISWMADHPWSVGVMLATAILFVGWLE